MYSVVFVVPCDQQWSHEKVREFCMQVRFMQYEMPKQQEVKTLNLKDCDINGFLHIFKVRLAVIHVFAILLYFVCFILLEI